MVVGWFWYCRTNVPFPPGRLPFNLNLPHFDTIGFMRPFCTDKLQKQYYLSSYK
jgi:hypothetical protein